jgi:pimeloyl-ACP methyl ester carboxylesterase
MALAFARQSRRVGRSHWSSSKSSIPDHVGDAGPSFTPQFLDDLWLRTFPDAQVTRLEDAGHFSQEDAHERIVPELLRFLAQPPDRSAADS